MKLTIYDFHKILDELDDLNVTEFEKNECYNGDTNKACYCFKWEWKGYGGFGEAFLINGKIDTNEVFCRDSFLRIDSEKKAIVKNISEVYNEPELAELIQYIVDIYLPRSQD